MPAITKTNKKPGFTLDPNMKDFSKDPYFVKKAERAKAFIAKHGLPEDIKATQK